MKSNEKRKFVSAADASLEESVNSPAEDAPLVKMRSNGSVLHLMRMDSSASLISQVAGHQIASSSNCAIFKANSAEN